MAEYQKRQDVWNACQWKGHGCEFDLDVEVTKKHGISGYGAKLGYYQDENNSMKTVRPSEYIVVSPQGKITTMTPDNFNAEFVVAKSTKPVNNVVSKQSNGQKDNAVKRPRTKRQAQVIDNR